MNLRDGSILDAIGYLIIIIITKKLRVAVSVVTGVLKKLQNC
jgi:hypothetical protein